MTNVWLQVNLADAIRVCADTPGRRILVLPAAVASKDALLELVEREQRGYREVELAEDRARLQALEAAIAQARANGPVTVNPRTGEAERQPGADPVRERQARELRAAIDAHQAALAAVGSAPWRAALSELVDRFELAQAGAAQEAPAEGVKAHIRTNSYGLFDDPEVRLIQRRILLGLDESGA